MRFFFFLSILICFAHSDMIYNFKNINLNYHDWLKNAENDANKKDFSYIGFEGGAGWSNAELYGFINLENPIKTYKEENAENGLRISGFFDLDISIENGWRIHFQDYTLHSYSFYVNDFVVGVGYKFVFSNLWFRPFLGLHHTYDSYYSGLNGLMGGWLFEYRFTFLSKKGVVFNWNEIEFGREKSFYLDDDGNTKGDGASWGLNGALSVWIYPLKDIALGVQYRYANHKLGNKAYQDALIYTLKLYF